MATTSPLHLISRSSPLTLVLAAAASVLPPLGAQPSSQGIQLGGLLIRQPASGTFEARPVAAFADTVAVSTHLGRYKTNYVQRFAELEPLILELGIRHLRTDPVIHPQAVANLRRLAAAGVRFTHTAHPDQWGVPEGEDARGLPAALLTRSNRDFDFIPAFLEHLKANLLEGTEIIEGLNEPDHHLEHAKQWAGELRRLGRADPAFARVKFLGSALSNARVNAVKAGNWNDVADLANLHAYPGGRAPELSIAEYLEALAHQYTNLPIHITETGYHNALTNPPERHRPVSREVDAIYVPRLYLEYFRLGIARSYDYQLLDDRTEEEALKKYAIPVLQEAHFGIIDYNLKPKPVYHAIKNLLSILRDTGEASFQPRSLHYSLRGPEELRHVLLQKANGALYLAVWRAITIWDPVTRRDLPLQTAVTSVDLGQRFPTIRVYRPTQAPDFVETLRNTNLVELQLGAEVVLLELSAARS